MDPLTIHEALKNNYQGNVEARDLFAEPPINKAFKDATLIAQESYSTAQNALDSHESYRDELAALII